MGTYEKLKSLYAEVLGRLNSSGLELCRAARALEAESKRHLFGVMLSEKYGLNVDPTGVTSTEWVRIDEYCSVSVFGKKHNRTISWPDDGRQPYDGEILLCISFPTGAYIFGDDYKREYFESFFDELKNIGPKYIDRANHSLYYEIGVAKKACNAMNALYKKYREGADRERIRLEVEDMKRKISEYESEEESKQ